MVIARMQGRVFALIWHAFRAGVLAHLVYYMYIVNLALKDTVVHLHNFRISPEWKHTLLKVSSTQVLFGTCWYLAECVRLKFKHAFSTCSSTAVMYSSPAQNTFIGRYSDKPVHLQCRIAFGDESKNYLVANDKHVHQSCDIAFRVGNGWLHQTSTEYEVSR